MNKICIFGGTFNPIHNGHISLAKEAYAKMNFDKFIFVPTGNSYMKKDCIDKYHRYNMVKLATKDLPFCEVSDIEINREGPSYTFETVLYYKNLYPDSKLYFLMGEDSLRYLKSWKNPEIICKYSEPVVITRPDNPFNYDISSKDELSILTKNIEKEYNTRIHLINYQYNLSSTEVRKKIHDKKVIAEYISAEVYEYIKEHNLYN